MKNNKYARVYNPHDFRSDKSKTAGEREFRRAKYLLNFDGDPNSITEGLKLLSISSKLGFEEAKNELYRIRWIRI